MWQYNYTDELCHYGVPGMKWGVRKASYNDAKKQYRTASKDVRRIGRRAFGIKGIREYNAAKKKANDSYANMIVEKTKYKTSNSKNAERAELKSYTKYMYKTGLPGSVLDSKRGDKSTALYDRLVKDKGRKYADKVIKKVENKAVSQLATISTVATGLAIASAILVASNADVFRK